VVDEGEGFIGERKKDKKEGDGSFWRVLQFETQKSRREEKGKN
jgi:hypothetical protein